MGYLNATEKLGIVHIGARTGVSDEIRAYLRAYLRRSQRKGFIRTFCLNLQRLKRLVGGLLESRRFNRLHVLLAAADEFKMRDAHHAAETFLNFGDVGVRC